MLFFQSYYWGSRGRPAAIVGMEDLHDDGEVGSNNNRKINGICLKKKERVTLTLSPSNGVWGSWRKTDEECRKGRVPEQRPLASQWRLFHWGRRQGRLWHYAVQSQHSLEEPSTGASSTWTPNHNLNCCEVVPSKTLPAADGLNNKQTKLILRPPKQTKGSQITTGLGGFNFSSDAGGGNLNWGRTSEPLTALPIGGRIIEPAAAVGGRRPDSLPCCLFKLLEGWGRRNLDGLLRFGILRRIESFVELTGPAIMNKTFVKLCNFRL